MSALSVGRKRRSPVKVISEWLRGWVTAASPLSELSCCANDELDRLARDLGMSASDLRNLVRLDPDAAALLPSRMTALYLDPSEIAKVEPGTFQDLQRVCSLCESHKQCARDLGRDPNNETWEDYCPNVATLKALNAMPWAARREW